MIETDCHLASDSQFVYREMLLPFYIYGNTMLITIRYEVQL